MLSSSPEVWLVDDGPKTRHLKVMMQGRIRCAIPGGVSSTASQAQSRGSRTSVSFAQTRSGTLYAGLVGELLTRPSSTFILLMAYVCRCLAMCDTCREALASKSAPAKHRCPCCRQSFVISYHFNSRKLIHSPFQCGWIFEDLHSLEKGNINHVFI